MGWLARRKRRGEAQDAAVLLVFSLRGRCVRSMAGSRQVDVDLPTPTDAKLWATLVKELGSKESLADAMRLAKKRGRA